MKKWKIIIYFFMGHDTEKYGDSYEFHYGDQPTFLRKSGKCLGCGVKHGVF